MAIVSFFSQDHCNIVLAIQKQGRRVHACGEWFHVLVLNAFFLIIQTKFLQYTFG